MWWKTYITFFSNWTSCTSFEFLTFFKHSKDQGLSPYPLSIPLFVFLSSFKIWRTVVDTPFITKIPVLLSLRGTYVLLFLLFDPPPRRPVLTLLVIQKGVLDQTERKRECLLVNHEDRPGHDTGRHNTGPTNDPENTLDSRSMWCNRGTPGYSSYPRRGNKITFSSCFRKSERSFL